MEANESRIRYLEAIQRVVDRLSNTSGSYKVLMGKVLL